ncbi:MAG TPA: hypothetical protein ENI26_01875 [Methylophaga aminisulfidivorans]|uniref:Uncharacterized protein n=1 Tax=Methylophaga aminisulfidivorans TaxID=230105 RepID=A0A7C1VQS0_9GAMM|nr:hypothetical protein [Methylophaga aminisulfidivorans]
MTSILSKVKSFISVRFFNALTLLSQSANGLLLGGNPDESISARCFRQGELDGDAGWYRAMKVVDFIFSPFQKKHCYKAWLTDFTNAQKIVRQY